MIESIKETKVALKGPITTPVGTGFRSVNVALRKALDLYACVRPCKSYEGVRSKYEDIDLVIVRENTEDLYAGIEFEKGTPEVQALIEKIVELEPSAKSTIREHAGHLDQADLGGGHPADREATPSTTPARTAARRSPRSTRPTS